MEHGTRADCAGIEGVKRGDTYSSKIAECRLERNIEPVPLPESIRYAIPDYVPPFGFGLLSQTVFLRSYARAKSDGSLESWRDVVERVMTGLWSIFSWHMRTHMLPFDEERWTEFLHGSMLGMYDMKWSPPGRGLWMMGTDFVYRRGGTALNNCAAISTKDGLVESAGWAMDTLMNGGGVGFDTFWLPKEVRPQCDSAHAGQSRAHADQSWAHAEQARARGEGPRGVSWDGVSVHTIPDTREGWVWSVKVILNAYLRESPEYADEFTYYPEFDYSRIRPRGSAICGFGGVASGPDPLHKLHDRLRCFLDMFMPKSGVFGREWPEGVPRCVHTIEEFFRRLVEIDYPAPRAARDARDAQSSESGVEGSAHNEEMLAKFTAAAAARGPAWRYDEVRLVADVFNAIGECVVSGNVRRSSEIAIGRPESETFRDLKNFDKYPERESIGHLSNNSIRFTETEQYTKYLPDIVERISLNGEPGLLFQLNMTRYGRMSRPPQARVVAEMQERGLGTREFEEDAATLCNPCGEIALESHEFCNLSEVPMNKFLFSLPRDPACPSILTRWEYAPGSVNKEGQYFDIDGFIEALEYATFYCKCVSLLPCHSSATNAVVARNRRIGVSLSGIAVVYDTLGATQLIDILKRGYRAVRMFDAKISRMMGVVPSIRVTTCKPSGTISLLTGSTPGVHFAVAGRYAKRRVIVGNAVPLCDVLKAIGVENEPSVCATDATCFTFYIDCGQVRGQRDVSVYELLSLVSTVQREWADNMVSTTITFDKDREGPQLEQAIANFAPLLKSCAFLPSDCGAYPQMPYEAITREQYIAGAGRVPCDVDLAVALAKHTLATGERSPDPEAPKYCDGVSCELPRRK